MYLWKQWKKISARFENLKRLKIPKGKAWNGQLPTWLLANSPQLDTDKVTNNEYRTIGYDDISKRYEVLHLNH